MKKLAAAILLIVLCAQMICAENPQQSQQERGSVYGIEAGALYQGRTIIEILEAAEDEAELAVKEAYEAGYKAGRIDGSSLWKDEYEKMAAQYEKEKKKDALLLWGIAGGIAAGFLAASLIGLNVR